MCAQQKILQAWCDVKKVWGPRSTACLDRSLRCPLVIPTFCPNRFAYTHWECRCMYIWVQRFIRVSICIYIYCTLILELYMCVSICLYITSTCILCMCMSVCVCVGVCVQIYFWMGLSLRTDILRANVSKRAGPFGTLGSPHVSASSKPSKLSTASSCFFFCLQIHWLITWRMDGQRMDVMDESHWIDVKRISNICILLFVVF